VARAAIDIGHNVSIMIRSEAKLHAHPVPFEKKVFKRIRNVFVGDAADAAALATALAGMECVIECLANDIRPTAVAAIIKAVGDAGCPRLVCLGGTPALLLPSGYPAGPSMGMQRLADLHLHVFGLLRASSIPHWTQVCPSRMVLSEDGKPTGKFGIRPFVVDLEVYAAKAELTYEDTATAVVNIATVESSGFDKLQVAFFLKVVPPLKTIN